MGVVALKMSFAGFSAHPRATDALTAVPNLITGIFSLAGAAAFFARMRWATYVYAFSVLGHFVSHGLLLNLLYEHFQSDFGRVAPISFLVLGVVPVVSILVLMAMHSSLRQSNS